MGSLQPVGVASSVAHLVVADLMKVGVDLPDGIEPGRHRGAHHVVGFPRELAAG